MKRRSFLGLLHAAAGLVVVPGLARASADQRRFRVICDNDFSGDPDGLFQLAHHLRSPSVEVRAIIGSHLHADEIWAKSEHQATDGANKARELLGVMGLTGKVPVHIGSEKAMVSATVPARSAAVDAIIAEAMRDDPLPLFYCAGAGLTDLASALLIEPRIAKRLTLVWIGGPEYPGLGLPVPGGSPGEYNITIDVAAAQVVFNRSDVAIWQVPRNTYRRMLFSMAELEAMKENGGTGAWLAGQISGLSEAAAKVGLKVGEAYALGDSPLVTLTVLQSAFEPDPASSDYAVVPAPTVQDDGTCRPNPKGRPIRVYTTIDTRLTFGDMLAKLRK
ncbi:nucleoside hydrolase [Novosphingobium subterraneum]|uniref:nucleoside hydrolase n=1 Tax=Novosphingobium subterraneum TaxID=48936 RepID=UPI003CFC4405